MYLLIAKFLAEFRVTQKKVFYCCVCGHLNFFNEAQLFTETKKLLLICWNIADKYAY